MYSDLIIVGGGPAGSSLALYMATHGWQVTLVDDGRYTGFKPGEGLVPAAKRILIDLGVWEEFEQQGHRPSFGNESLWGSKQVQSSDYIRSIDGNGWRLDRLAFDQLLRDRGKRAGVKQVKGFVEQVERIRVSGEGPTEQKWKLRLRDGRELEGGWLADATGRSARIARQCGAMRQEMDQLVSFYMHFRAGREGDEYSASLIEAVPEGWWYNALLPDGRRVVYFFSDAGLPVIKQVQDKQGFLDLLAHTQFVGQRLEDYEYQADGLPQAADARSARIDKVFGPGWLAVGDAALSFDPLSSQGILTALYGGLKAGKALFEASETGNAKAMDAYADAMERVWGVYIYNRTKFYRSETRWIHEPFWGSRFRGIKMHE